MHYYRLFIFFLVTLTGPFYCDDTHCLHGHEQSSNAAWELAEKALIEDLPKLRMFHDKALAAVSDGVTDADVETVLDLLSHYAMGAGGLRDSIATFENTLDPTNSSEDARAINALLNSILKREMQALCEAATLASNECNRLDCECVTLCFTGLMEVGGQFNSVLVYHTIPHSLGVATLAALGSEADGPSAMLRAAAEGAYHDSRMIYQENGKRRVGVDANCCEGASGDALVSQIEQLRGQTLTHEEKVEWKKRINRTVPVFVEEPARTLHAVVNRTMLDAGLQPLCDRVDLDACQYNEVSGLSDHLRALTLYYRENGHEAILTKIAGELNKLKDYRVGQADLSEILFKPEEAVAAGGFNLWMEENRSHAYALINLDKTLLQDDGADQVSTAVDSLRVWMGKQVLFPLRTAIFREEYNYYPLIAMRGVLEHMHLEGFDEAMLLLQTVLHEIRTFEKLYCTEKTTIAAIEQANADRWNIKAVCREGFHHAEALAQWADQATPEEISISLKKHYQQSTGRLNLPSEAVSQAFIFENTK